MHDDLIIEKFLCNTNRKKLLLASPVKAWVVTKFLPYFIPNISPLLISSGLSAYSS